MDPFQIATLGLSVGRLCLFQVVVMLAVVAFFVLEPQFAQSIYVELKPLGRYLPIMWRYQRFLELDGATSSFPVLFSVSISNIAIQVLFLTAIFISIRRKMTIHLAGGTLKINLLCIFLSVLSLMATVDLFVGPENLASSYLGTMEGPPSVGVYILNCFVVPGANILLALLVIAKSCMYDSKPGVPDNPA